MAYLKTFEECESFVRIATLEPPQLCYLQIPIQEALQVKTYDDYLAVIRMLRALIDARNELDQFPYASISICGMVLYRVSFTTITVHITTQNDILVIVLAL